LSKDLLTNPLVPFPFVFTRLNALQAAVRHSHSLSDPVLCLVTQANMIAFSNAYWTSFKAMKKINAMPALLKFLVLLAIFLLASNANAFTSLSPVAGNQVWVNHLIQFDKSMSKPTNQPSCKSQKPTND
jgi:hypothetical protein